MYYKNFNSKNSYLAKCNLVIIPDSTFHLFWNMIVLVLLSVNIFYIPIKIVFILPSENSNSQS